MRAMTTIGLMSGTSLDGIDVALIETDGETISRFGPTGYFAYGGSERDVLRAALREALSLKNRDERPGILAAAEAVITRSHQKAVQEFLKGNGLSPSGIDAVGFHGQTVLHRPDERLTVQIGDGDDLAAALSIPVVYDFRAADVAAGGQGAPLVPVFHRALVEAAALERPVAIVNIGGVANITLVGSDGQISSFDTGPGNALLDDWVSEQAGLAFDIDGKLAAEGKVDAAVLDRLLAHPYFRLSPPKSLDRNSFEVGGMSHLSPADGAATLTAFTVGAIAKAVDHAGFEPRCWILTGGGAQNSEMRRMLAALTGIAVRTADEFGWSSAFMEAQAFAYLAARTIRGLPLSFPTTTGVKEPMTGGVLALAEGRS